MSKRLTDKQELIIASAGTLAADTTWFYTSSIQVTDESPSGTIDGQNDTFNLQNYPVTLNSLSMLFTEYPDITGETPSGDIDGQNQTFTSQNVPIVAETLEITLIDYTDMTGQTPTGDIDSSNMTYLLFFPPSAPPSIYTKITQGTVSIFVDGGSQITDTDDGDGTGTLSDGGSITYSTGEFTLTQQPTTTVEQDYTYQTETTITDTDDQDGTGTLSDGGSITYQTGEIILNQQPQQTSDLLIDYTFGDNETTITDDGEGNLNNGTSDVGTIDYNTGEIIFNTQPTTGDTILQDYSYDVLIDVSRYKGVLLEFKVTFQDNQAVSGDVEIYITNSIDGTDFNATLEQQTPLRFVSPIQNTTVTVVEKYFCPLDYNLSIGVKNNDQSYGVDITCEYKLVNV